jgi:hypothetical protein
MSRWPRSCSRSRSATRVASSPWRSPAAAARRVARRPRARLPALGGVPDRIVVDNAKAMVLTHARDAIVWNATSANFTVYYGVRPWACVPSRSQTKGKVESVASELPPPGTEKRLHRLNVIREICTDDSLEDPESKLLDM